MPRATWFQANLNAGEWSPLTFGRVTLEKYKNALAKCLNYVPTPQGGLTRRPGNYYVSAVKDSTKSVRLQRFEFSTTQAYVLEFGDQYIRFYTNDGQLLSGGSPYEVATTYAAADLFNLSFAQSADVLYIVHPNYAPRKLQRLGATSWALSTISFLDGPYLILNTTATTLTLSATSGSVTVTASATTGINNGAGFSSSDIGRALRFKSGANWGWGTITAVASTTVCTVSLTTSPSAATASTLWRLGVWGTTNGYPQAVCFHEDRLVFAGCTNYPQRIDGSNSSDYENFAPSAQDGTIANNNAYSFSLNSNTVNSVRWIQSDEKGMLVGTAGGEWILRGTTAYEAISPTNVQAKQPTTYGSAAVQSVKIGKATLFVQRNGRRLREMAYVFTEDGFRSPDISQLAEHLPARGIKQMAMQWTPHQVMWAVANDGSLLSLTYDREQEVVSWAQHTLGGFYNSANTQAARIESVACIPSSDGTRDELYMVVNRYINGANIKYVERSAKYWENGDTLTSCCFLDSAGTYSGAPTTTITGLTWLKGQTVSVLGDGATHPDCVVDSSGVITLQRSISNATVGLSYNSDGQTMQIEAGGADGTAQGKKKRIHWVTFRFWQTVGHQLLANISGTPTYVDQSFRDSSMPMDSGVGLFTGDFRWSMEGTWDTTGQISWRQNQPLPSNILGIIAQLETQDGG